MSLLLLFPAVASGEAVGSATGTSSALGRTDAAYTELGANALPFPYTVVQSRAAANVQSGTGASDGTSTVAATGASTYSATASAAGTSTASGQAASTGAIAGTSTASGTGASTAAATAASGGTSTTEATGASIAAGVGSCDGTSTASFLSDAATTVEGVAESVGTSTASGISGAQEEERPAGGYGWANLADLDRRRRRKRELEEEADRLETALIAEQLLPPNPEVETRVTVREYPIAQASRRTQRAIAYAEKARTAAAYELALRAIQKEIEDEETAVATLLALVA